MLKLKGVGPLSYHIGCGYTTDEDGTLAPDPRNYVSKILESYEEMFGEKPKKTRTPLVAEDHPEINLSEFCDQDQIKAVANNCWTVILDHWIGEI